MNNLNLILKNNQIKNLTYDTVVTERPMSNIVDFDYKTILDPPPENTSTKTRKELELISNYTSERTARDLKLVFGHDEDMDQYYEALLNKHGLPYPRRYIYLFYDIVEPILMNIKSYWNRPRPSQLAVFYGIRIDTIMTDTIWTASYPSGHTVYSRLVANILAKMYPELKNKLDQIAEETGIARIKQGVHYPSDNEASIIFSDFVHEKLHSKLVKYRNQT